MPPSSIPQRRLRQFLVVAFALLALLIASLGQHALTQLHNWNLALTLYGGSVAALIFGIVFQQHTGSSIALMSRLSGMSLGERTKPPLLLEKCRRLYRASISNLSRIRPTRPIVLSVLSVLSLAVSVVAVDRQGLASLTLAAWGGALGFAFGAALPSIRKRAAGRRVLWTGFAIGEFAAVFAMVSIGAALRLYHLSGIPGGIHGDETEFGLLARTVLAGQGPNPFGTAFLGDPALYVYILALFLALFGNEIEALRLSSAVAGVVTLIAFYFVIRRMFGVRPGLFGLALLTGSAVHVDFSRLALNVILVPLFICLVAWSLWEGQLSRRRGWWLASGIFGGLAFYSHFGGRLAVLIIGFYFVYLLSTRRESWRAWIAGASLALLGGVIALAPFLVHLSDRSNQLTDHVGGRLIFNAWDRATAAQSTTNVLGVLAGQVKTNVLAFVTGADAGPFYGFAGSPLLSPSLAPLFVLGMAFMMAKARDVRYGLLVIWFWTFVLVGGALTVDSPQFHRLMPAVLPSFAGVALLLDWLVGLGARLGGRKLTVALIAGSALVPLIAGYQDESNFLRRANEAWQSSTVQARYIASLGNEYRVYSLSSPYMYFDHSTTRFLSPKVEGGTLQNPAADLPVATSADRHLAFLVYPPLYGYLPVLHSFYPQAQFEVVKSAAAGEMFTAVRVSRDDIARFQGLTAQYGGVQAVETNVGSLGRSTPNYPSPAQWSGSIYMQRDGPYMLQIDGPASNLRVDGISVGSGESREYSAGWHVIEFSGLLDRPGSTVALRWRPPGGPLSEVGSRWLDARTLPAGLRARISSADGRVSERRDRAIGFRALTDLTRAAVPATATWEGILNLNLPGRYSFSLNAEGDAQLTIDGATLAAKAGGSGLGSTAGTVDLTAGAHVLNVTYTWRGGPGTIELSWIPPGGQSSLVPPEAFAPLIQQ